MKLEKTHNRLIIYRSNGKVWINLPLYRLMILRIDENIWFKDKFNLASRGVPISPTEVTHIDDVVFSGDANDLFKEINKVFE